MPHPIPFRSPHSAQGHDPGVLSLSYVLVVMFPRSRAAAYPAAIAAARRAALCADQPIGKAVYHVAAFSAEREEAARALSIIRGLHGTRGLQVFAGGKRVQDPYRVERVLTCYLDASAADDRLAHCVQWVPNLFDREQDAPHLFPCRLLWSFGARVQAAHPSTHQAQIQAAAVRAGCDWCPLFNPKEMRPA